MTRLAVPCFDLITDTEGGWWHVIEDLHSSDSRASRAWSFATETRARQRLATARRAHHDRHGCDPLHP